jgi:Apoptogenic protein 1
MKPRRNGDSVSSDRKSTTGTISSGQTTTRDSFLQIKLVLFQEKEKFLAQFPEKRTTADELSVFYKEFLNANHGSHMAYNKELYKRSVGLLWPEFLVSVQRIARRFIK